MNNLIGKYLDRYHILEQLGEDGTKDLDDSGNPVQFSGYTPRLLRAVFNYQLVNELNPDSYAHNPEYVIQLIYDSIENLGGDVSKFLRP